MTSVVEVSGGFDSALSAWLVAKEREVFPIFFDYGQEYALQEYHSAIYVHRMLVGLPGYRCRSALRRVQIDLTTKAPVGSVREYVPIRNLVFCAASANYAQAVGASSVVVGSKTLEYRPGDPYSFRDCTREFYDRVADLVALASERPELGVKFEQPLIINGVPMTKLEVLIELHTQGFDLRRLWTCYVGGDGPCKSCYHCKVVAECVDGCDKLAEYAGHWGSA